MITWENYEEYMMMYADGELQPAEVQTLMAFINEHPQLKSELAAYERVHVVADTSITYADKEALLQPLPAKRIALVSWQRYAIAAGVAAILFLSVYKLRESANTAENYAVVQHDTIKTSVAPSLPVTVPVVKEQVAVVKEEQKEMPATKQQVQTVNNSVATVIHKHTQQQGTTQITHNEQFITQPEVVQNMEQLPIAQAKEMKMKPTAMATISGADVPDHNKVNATEKQSLWDKLPMDEIKKKQLGAIANAVAGAYKDVTQPGDGGNKFSIRIEKKRLVLSF